VISKIFSSDEFKILNECSYREKTNLLTQYFELLNEHLLLKGSGGLVVKLSASQDHGLEPYLGHDHFSLYATTSTGWFQEVDSESY
jgi:hypothetical protein